MDPVNTVSPQSYLGKVEDVPQQHEALLASMIVSSRAVAVMEEAAANNQFVPLASRPADYPGT